MTYALTAKSPTKKKTARSPTSKESARKYWLYAVLLLAAALALAATWRWTPLGDLLDKEALAAFVRHLRSSPWAPLLIIGAYIGASFIMMPNTLLNFATIVGLGSYYGFFCALSGSMAAALCMYGIGRKYGADKLHKLQNNKVDAISRHFRKGGVAAVFSVRIIPVAPFPVVNLMAGVCKIKLWHYAVGTLAGLLPGTVLVALFGRQLRRLTSNPGWQEFLLLGGIVAAAGFGLFWAQRKAKNLT